MGILQLRFSNINPKHTMKVYSVPTSLKYYTTTLKDRKAGFERLPESKYRKKEQELAGSEDLQDDEEEEKQAAQESETKGVTKQFRGSLVKGRNTDTESEGEVADENVYEYVESNDMPLTNA